MQPAAPRLGVRPWALTTALALVVLAAVLVYALSDNSAVANVCYLGTMIGASIGAWIGAERAPRGQRLVPRLIAAGVSLTALGDTLWTILDAWGANTDVSMADGPWFASYVALCIALWVVLSRSKAGARIDLDFVVDAVTIVVVSVLIFWSISIDAIVADETVAPFVRAVWASYPIADAVLLALVVRIFLSRTARAAIGPSFAVGVALWLAADIAYLQDPASETVLTLMDAAWMVAPVLMARAAWRVREVEEAALGAPTQTRSATQLVVAVAPLGVPAGLELVADLRGQPDQPMQLLVGTAALATLAFVRTARLLRSEERAQRDLEVARDVALDASRAKSMFLANMSHEIRTPLTTVLATAEMLEDDTALDESQLMLLSKMQRSGEMLKSLVEQILDFSRIEAGELKLAEVPFDLHAAVADATDVYLPKALRAGITFKWDIHPGVPRTVTGDPGRLFQVLTNVLDNAVKFTPEGRVNLVVRAADDGELHGGGSRTGSDVLFVVSDTGIGIRDQDLDSVFDSFHQVDGSTTRRFGGNGLGLAICKELVERMNGTITVNSQLGAGSTFVIRLPLTASAAPRTTSLREQFLAE